MFIISDTQEIRPNGIYRVCKRGYDISGLKPPYTLYQVLITKEKQIPAYVGEVNRMVDSETEEHLAVYYRVNADDELYVTYPVEQEQEAIEWVIQLADDSYMQGYMYYI